MEYGKKNSNPNESKALFHELQGEFANHWYTDGSKTQNGYAIVSEDSPIKVKHSREATIFYCELKTLKHSIDKTANQRNKRFAIFCDSARVISTFQSQWTSHTVTQKCQKAYDKSSRMNNAVTTIRFPSHIGILISIVIDTSGKARKRANSTYPWYIGLSRDATIARLEMKIKEAWIKEWRTQAKPRLITQDNFFGSNQLPYQYMIKSYYPESEYNTHTHTHTTHASVSNEQRETSNIRLLINHGDYGPYYFSLQQIFVIRQCCYLKNIFSKYQTTTLRDNGVIAVSMRRRTRHYYRNINLLTRIFRNCVF